MAERVATWPQKYGIDGIDLDLEDGAGDTPKAGPNMIHFVKKLRQCQSGCGDFTFGVKINQIFCQKLNVC